MGARGSISNDRSFRFRCDDSAGLQYVAPVSRRRQRDDNFIVYDIDPKLSRLGHRVLAPVALTDSPSRRISTTQKLVSAVEISTCPAGRSGRRIIELVPSYRGGLSWKRPLRCT